MSSLVYTLYEFHPLNRIDQISKELIYAQFIYSGIEKYSHFIVHTPELVTKH